MSNKLSPLSKSTSALLEFWIWSDAVKPRYPWYCLFVMHTALDQTGCNWFEMATATKVDPNGKFNCYCQNFIICHMLMWYLATKLISEIQDGFT